MPAAHGRAGRVVGRRRGGRPAAGQRDIVARRGSGSRGRVRAMGACGACLVRRFGTSVLRRFGASALRRFGASALRRFGASALRRFGASALRRFGASIDTTRRRPQAIFAPRSTGRPRPKKRRAPQRDACGARSIAGYGEARRDRPPMQRPPARVAGNGVRQSKRPVRAMSISRAIRSSVAGCVENRFCSPPPDSGFMIIICAVAGCSSAV